MIDTAGTLVQAAQICQERGASEVHAVATHGVLSGPAVERIKDSCLKSVVITDTVPVPPEKRLPNITVLSVAPLLADAIECIHNDRSVSTRLQQNNVRQTRLL